MPGTGVQLANHFTIYTCDQVHSPVNRVTEKMLGDTCEPWRGNVLIIKNDPREVVADITPEDLDLVGHIFTSCATFHFVSYAPYTLTIFGLVELYARIFFVPDETASETEASYLLQTLYY